MEISEEPIFPDFEEALRFSPQACHANRLPLPGSDEVRAMTVGSGRQLSMLLDLSSSLGAFSKILLESSQWGNSEEFVHIWSLLDTGVEFGGLALMPLGQNTEDSGCSLFVTPQAHDAHQGDPSRIGRFGTKHGGRNLADEVMTSKLWPTPRKEGYDSQGKGHGDLVYEVKAKLIPTPRNDHSGLESHGVTAIGGSLNPRFVEELMGFPIDHTALKRSETPLCHSKSTRSSRRSRKSS